MSKMALLSMSKVYEREDFYRPFINSYEYIDCSDIDGTNCYVDKEALKELRRRLEGIDARGIHFIDSGNYHYLTHLFLEKIPREFELVLIDKHPDCKASMFESLMSCGSWVKDALFNLPNLKRVYMIGVDTELLYELDDLGKCREQALVIRTPSKLLESKLPIYMSIDKDALEESVTSTNWDQGNMTLEELDEWIDYILDNRYLIGADICGEADFEAPKEEHLKNSEINSHLYDRLINS